MSSETKRIIGTSLGVTGFVLKKVLSWTLKIIGTLVIIMALTGLILTFIFLAFFDKYLKPEINISLYDFPLNLTSFVYSTDPATGEKKELEKLYGTQNRVWAEYDQIPQYLKDAAVAIEDKRFFSHNGVDWKRTMYAFSNIFLNSHSNFGGSTITQQLIKNLTDEKEVTVKRKLLEIFRALEFDSNYSKTEILEWYLNTIYLSQGCYGVKTAAEVYFAKDLSKLTLAECASLIGITNRPTLYDPYQNPEHNKERQTEILKQMLEQGMISKSEYTEAINQKLEFKRIKTQTSTSKQSYFVDQVISDVINDLIAQKGYSRQYATEKVYNGGYSIYATVDTHIQGIMDEVFSNEKNFPVTYGSDLPEAAMVVIDQKTGNIVGLVGGRGEKTLDRGLNRASQSYRQPGSSIKPVSVYAPAIDKGYITPSAVRDDAPLKLSSKNNMWPKNSTVSGYTGRMTIIRAVELSVNTVPVSLVNEMTPEVSFDFATQKLGLTSLQRELKKGQKVYSDVGLASMALGGLTKGVSVKDLTAAYAAFPNNGVYTKPRTYTQVVDSNGTVILDNRPKTEVAMEEETAFYMNYMLQSVVKNGTGKAAAMKNIAVAGKTGTTDEDKDRWFVGYTPYYTGGVWFGFDDPKEIDLEKSKNPALVMWKLVMDKVHAGLPAKSFEQPSDVVSASFCLDSGMAPTSNCRNDVRGSRVGTGLFFKKDVPTEACDVHVSVRIDVSTGMLATSYCPPGSIKRMALIKLPRFFNMAGVVLADQKYVILDGKPPKGSYAPSGGSRYAVYCSKHTASNPYVPPVETTSPNQTDVSPPPVETSTAPGDQTVVSPPVSSAPDNNTTAPVSEAPASVSPPPVSHEPTQAPQTVAPPETTVPQAEPSPGV